MNNVEKSAHDTRKKNLPHDTMLEMCTSQMHEDDSKKKKHTQEENCLELLTLNLCFSCLCVCCLQHSTESSAHDMTVSMSIFKLSFTTGIIIKQCQKMPLNSEWIPLRSNNKQCVSHFGRMSHFNWNYVNQNNNLGCRASGGSVSVRERWSLVAKVGLTWCVGGGIGNWSMKEILFEPIIKLFLPNSTFCNDNNIG